MQKPVDLPTIQRMADKLQEIGYTAYAHLYIYRDLNNFLAARPPLQTLSPGFLQLTIVSHLQIAAVHACKLVASSKQSLSVETFAKYCCAHAKLLPDSEPKVLAAELAETQAKITDIRQDMIEVIRWRDRFVAHTQKSVARGDEPAPRIRLSEMRDTLKALHPLACHWADRAGVGGMITWLPINADDFEQIGRLLEMGYDLRQLIKAGEVSRKYNWSWKSRGLLKPPPADLNLGDDEWRFL